MAIATIEPPTARLPPIATIATTLQLATGTAKLLEALEYLCTLYRPQVRGSRRRRRARSEEKGKAGNDDGYGDVDDAQQLQSGAFERAYAIRWLTALIAQLEAWREQYSPTSSLSLSNTPQLDCTPTIDDTDTLLQQAASLLATCAGVAAAGKVQRRFTFHVSLRLASLDAGKPENTRTQIQTQIDVLLTDIPLDNHNYASVGAQTWGGACVLAEMIAERPDRFGLLRSESPTTHSRGNSLDHHHDHCDVALLSSLNPSPARQRPLRILELGAGTGLVGLTVAKLLQVLPPPKSTRSNPNSSFYPTLDPPATVVLTDFYPAVLNNLQSNIDANFPLAPGDHEDTNTVHVYCHPLDWSSFPEMSKSQIPNVLSTPFDVVFGADIVYETQHAIWIRDCLTSLLRRPYPRPHPDSSSSTEDPAFHLVIPLRPTHAFESSNFEAVFGVPPLGRGSDEDGPQRTLTILSKEFIVCEAYGDERNRMDDDVEYVYYRIGWSK